jgi:hypothetical protein
MCKNVFSLEKRKLLAGAIMGFFLITVSRPALGKAAGA